MLTLTFIMFMLAQEDGKQLPTLEQAIMSLSKHKERFSNYSVHADVTDTRSSSNPSVKPRNFFNSFDIRRSGDNSYSSTTTKRNTQDKNKRTITESYFNEVIINQDQYLHLQYKDGLLQGGILAAIPPTSLHKQQSNAHLCISMLTLLFPSQKYDLVTIFRDCKCTIRVPNGQYFCALEAVDKHAKYVVDFDNSWNIKRISISSTNLIKDDPVAAKSDEQYYGKLLSSKTTCTVDKEALIDGVSAPIEITCVSEIISEKRGTETYGSKAVFSKYHFKDTIDPNAFLPEKSIPNGTKVAMEDQPQIEYEWWDGKIVKKINRDTVVGLAKHHFQRGYLGYIVILVPVFVIGIVIWFYWWKWKNTRLNQ